MLHHHNKSLVFVKSLLSVTVALATLGNPHVTQANDRLVGRAILPAETFAKGPTSGLQLGAGPINGIKVPFINKQPVQGFSAVLDNHDGTYWVMSDNGFGSLENSADYLLRVYRIQPNFKTATGGKGTIKVKEFIQLRDPHKKIPFTITRQFTSRRYLTGADFDIEAMQRAPDGTLWFGDEFGPFLLHTDSKGVVLEAPVALPDFTNKGEVRSPQNPYNEEASAVRIMNAVRAHAQEKGNHKIPVFSPYHVMLKYPGSNPDLHYARGVNSPADLAKAASDVFDIASIKSAGYPVVTWTINDKARMLEVMAQGVSGIISDRPDILLDAVKTFDGNKDGKADYLTADGFVDYSKFDAQGHRGGRDLRPENTLPAMEVALDYLMSTLETDMGVSKDKVGLLDHDPHIEAAKCRRADGQPYEAASQVLIKDYTAAHIQKNYICDKVFRGASQLNDLSLSPVALAFAAKHGLIDPYVMPTVQQLFDFVAFYVDYYKNGAGKSHTDASKRWQNAERVHYNIETKINPRAEYKHRTFGPRIFVDALAGAIIKNGLEERADIQSFDFRSLIHTQKYYPNIRTVYLFGDFPIYNGVDSDDGTNLQDEQGKNTPWLAGMHWPYRATVATHPFRAARSGGFEGMAMSVDGQKLYPLLERPLVGDDQKALLIHEFDLASGDYTGIRYSYPLAEKGTNIGDFVMFNDKEGLIIERDGTQGDLNGFKAIYQIAFGQPESAVKKELLVDLLNMVDIDGISEPIGAGDVGLGQRFAFPFVTIEDVFVLDSKHIGVLNDNNFPFSIGRHVGSAKPDDNEFIIIQLNEALNVKK